MVLLDRVKLPCAGNTTGSFWMCHFSCARDNSFPFLLDLVQNCKKDGILTAASASRLPAGRKACYCCEGHPLLERHIKARKKDFAALVTSNSTR